MFTLNGTLFVTGSAVQQQCSRWGLSLCPRCHLPQGPSKDTPRTLGPESQEGSMKDGLEGVKLWPLPNRIKFYVFFGRGGGQSAHSWTTFNGLGWVRQKKCDNPQTVERGSTVRALWHWCVSPGLTELPLAGGTAGATRFFFNPATRFLVWIWFLWRADSCVELILVKVWFLWRADSCVELILVKVWFLFRADSCVGLIGVNWKMSRYTVWGVSGKNVTLNGLEGVKPWPLPNRLTWHFSLTSTKPSFTQKAVGGPFGSDSRYTANMAADWQVTERFVAGVERGSKHEETDGECVGLHLKQGVFPKHDQHQQLVWRSWFWVMEGDSVTTVEWCPNVDLMALSRRWSSWTWPIRLHRAYWWTSAIWKMLNWCKTLWGDQDLRTSTLVPHRPIQGESNIDFLGEPEGSLPQPHDSHPDAGEALNDFWSMSGNFIYRHHVERRVKLYSPREESFLIPLKYIDVTRTTHTNLDVKQEKRIDDYWNIDGSRDLSDPWTGFTHSIGRKTSGRIYVVRGEINEKTAYIQARSSMARALEINGKARQAEGEAKVV